MALLVVVVVAAAHVLVVDGEWKLGEVRFRVTTGGLRAQPLQRFRAALAEAIRHGRSPLN